MSRPPQLEPAWLIGLLMAWSRRTSAGNGLGYPPRCAYLEERVGRSVQSVETFEPMGYGGEEIEEVGRLIDKLRLMRKMAILRFCKPWMIPAVDIELGRFDTDTWLYHLKKALAELAGAMEPQRVRA